MRLTYMSYNRNAPFEDAAGDNVSNPEEESDNVGLVNPRRPDFDRNKDLVKTEEMYAKINDLARAQKMRDQKHREAEEAKKLTQKRRPGQLETVSFA